MNSSMLEIRKFLNLTKLKESIPETLRSLDVEEQTLCSCFMFTRNQKLKKIYVKIEKSKDEDHDISRVVLKVLKSKRDETALIDQDISKCVFKLNTDTQTKQIPKKISSDLLQEEEEEKKLEDIPKNDETEQRVFWTL